MNPDPASASGAAPAHLDADALARLQALDPDGRHGVVQRVLSTYDASVRRLLEQLEAAAAAGDTATVGHVAHTLKSSSASIGALALAAVCAETERVVREGATAPPGSLVTALLTEGRAALQAVAAILQDGPAAR